MKKTKNKNTKPHTTNNNLLFVPKSRVSWEVLLILARLGWSWLSSLMYLRSAGMLVGASWSKMASPTVLGLTGCWLRFWGRPDIMSLIQLRPRWRLYNITSSAFNWPKWVLSGPKSRVEILAPLLYGRSWKELWPFFNLAQLRPQEFRGLDWSSVPTLSSSRI